MKLLFVCTGNSCRSVMAQFLLPQLAAARGLEGWESRSCGIAAERYFEVPAGVLKALAERGIADLRHVPQLVSRDLLRWADAVYAMSRLHKEFLLDQFPEFGRKVELFLEHHPDGPQDVEDPIGKSDEVYRRCRDVIESGLGRLLERHAPRNA